MAKSVRATVVAPREGAGGGARGGHDPAPARHDFAANGQPRVRIALETLEHARKRRIAPAPGRAETAGGHVHGGDEVAAERSDAVEVALRPPIRRGFVIHRKQRPMPWIAGDHDRDDHHQDAPQEQSDVQRSAVGCGRGHATAGLFASGNYSTTPTRP